MTRKTRRLLFYVAFVIFLFLSFVAVIYARGYKYSFDEQRFVRTGAISMKLNTDANVYINDKLTGTTSFLGNSFSKGGLLPGQYSIRISKDNYTAWQKKVSVQEGFVTDFPKIMILSETEEEREKIINEIEIIFEGKKPSSPSDPFYIKNKKLYSNNGPEPEVIAQEVLGFSLSPNENKLAWWNTNNEIRVMWLKNADYQPYRGEEDIELITRFSTKIKKIDWFRGEDHIVVDSLGYKIIEIDTRGGINIIKL